MINVPRQLGLDHTWQPSPALLSWMNQVSTGLNTGTYVPLTTSGALVYDSGAAAGALAASAVLEARSTTRGFLPPRMTAVERAAIASPADGLIVFDTTGNRLYYYVSPSWRQIVIL